MKARSPGRKAVPAKKCRALAVPADRVFLRDSEPRLEIRRRWPDELPMRDLLVVATKARLDGPRVPPRATGRALALVDVVDVRDWREEEGAAACAVCRDAGWLNWHVSKIRWVEGAARMPVRAGIYEVPRPKLLRRGAGDK